MCRLTHLLVALIAISTYSRTTVAQEPNALVAHLKSLAQPGAKPLDERHRIDGDVNERLRAWDRRMTVAWRAVEDLADWQTVRDTALAELRKSLGHFPHHSPDVQVRVAKSQTGEGFVVDNILYESFAGLWITANLYRPAQSPTSAPGFVICHAHHTPKTHGELQDMGMTWARLGAYVLVPDQIGHGERREHPFRGPADYTGEYRVSRQDYYFRYDLGVQTHLAGSSLIGQMVWDLSRGFDVLLALPGIDSKRIALLGSVAGGGDPAAVAGALDDRVSVVVPFNFGGPQPETRFPLPDDAEESFRYAGSGGWEPTRNLKGSAAGGFLPWVVVGGIAPRRLIYAHEFAWDRERDPVWKRLGRIYELHGAADSLAFTHGRGSVKGQAPESTHCTHIGAEHRERIHTALAGWFGLPDGARHEFSQRLPAESLLCWVPAPEARRRPHLLREVLLDQMNGAARARQGILRTMWASERARTLRVSWHAAFGGNADPPAAMDHPQDLTTAPKRERDPGSFEWVERHVGGDDPERPLRFGWLIPSDRSLRVPTLLLVPKNVLRAPVVVAVASAGKEQLLVARADTIAALLRQKVAVCLVDLCGMGETRVGDGRDRASAATSASSSELMLGTPRVRQQLRELRGVIGCLRRSSLIDGERIAVWGDSLAESNATNANFQVPHGVDGRPRDSEPAGALLALLAGIHEPNLRAVYARGGLARFRDVLAEPWVYIPHDVVTPGMLVWADVSDLAMALAPRPLRIAATVDGLNRRMEQAAVDAEFAAVVEVYKNADAAGRVELADQGSSDIAEWLAANLLDRPEKR